MSTYSELLKDGFVERIVTGGSTDGHNAVYRVRLTGGIVGFIAGSTKTRIAAVCRMANEDGYEVVLVLNDSSNLLQRLWTLLLLVLTLLLWCPLPGYLVITRRLRAGADDLGGNEITAQRTATGAVSRASTTTTESTLKASPDKTSAEAPGASRAPIIRMENDGWRFTHAGVQHGPFESRVEASVAFEKAVKDSSG